MAAGLISVFFIKSLYSIEDFFKKIKVHSVIKSLSGGLLLGVIGLISLRVFGHYYFYGVGYVFLTEVLTDNIPQLLILVGILLVKVVATSLTLASGGSGGIFAPSLFLGAAVGAIIGVIVNSIFPEATAGPSAYAIVGMAAMVSGVTGASLTSIIMIFEMTRNYEIMLPLMLSVVVAHFVSDFIYNETIYTEKLTRRGIMIQLHKRIPIFNTITVGEVVKEDLQYCSSESTVKHVLDRMHEKEIGLLPVIDANVVKGTIGYEELYKARDLKTDKIGSYIKKTPIYINTGSNLFEALRKMEELKTNILVVVGEGRILGFVTRNRVIKSYMEKRSRL